MVVDKFKESKENRFAVVDAPRGDTMILELAVTQLVPNKAFLGAIGLAAWAAPLPVGVPVGILATFADDGWMAIEGRVRDAKSGKVIAMFADREAAKTRVVDVEAVTWYGQARESMNDWADQFVLLANTPRDVTVEDSSAFTLMPWGRGLSFTAPDRARAPRPEAPGARGCAGAAAASARTSDRRARGAICRRSRCGSRRPRAPGAAGTRRSAARTIRPPGSPRSAGRSGTDSAPSSA